MLGEHGVVGYSWNHLCQHYRLTLLLHVAGMVGWLATAKRSTVVGREGMLLDATSGDGRIPTAIADYDLT